MSNAAVLVEYRDQVVAITLNRPEVYNACNAELRAGMRAITQELAIDKTVRVVIITATGKGFCAGADLREGTAPLMSEHLHAEYEPFLFGLRRLDKVVLAAVNGACAGIGCGFLAAADLAIMAEDAYMQLAFSKIGLVPDGGISFVLVRALGQKRANRLMMEAGRLSAQECLQYGLVNEVVNGADLQARAWEWAAQICELSPIANALIKRITNQAAELSLSATFALEAALQDVAAAGPDSKEGIAAFLEKRKAKFPGK
jgi:2-(1,2-epoxy-1,2-dihydrophenyl)acetyl-CoA isomerase